MSNPPRASGPRRPPRVIVFGYHDIGVACLHAVREQGGDIVLVVTHEVDPAENVWFASVADAAAGLAIRVVAPPDPNAPAFVERVRRLEPDLLFSFYYRQLLGPALLAVPRLAAVNLHGSLLPKYRGRAPINWALIHGETLTGVTLHHMDERADHGDIIAQRAVPIAVEDTALSLSRKVTEAARSVVRDTYPSLVAGQAPRIPQDHAAATVFGRRRPEDGLIDWRVSAWPIYNLVRAVTHPFPGAFTWWNGRRVFIWKAWPPRDHRSVYPAGRVVAVGTQGGLEVATGAGILEVARLQVEGEREVDAAEIVTAGTDIVFGGTAGAGG